jgi:hypothetical protein
VLHAFSAEQTSPPRLPLQSADGSTKATLFAPTNDAFVALLNQLNLTPAQLLNDTELVTEVLNYHIIPGPKIYSDEFKNGKSYKTMLAGKRLKVTAACVLRSPVCRAQCVCSVHFQTAMPVPRTSLC